MKPEDNKKLKKKLRAMIPSALPDLCPLFPDHVTRDRVYAILQLLFLVRRGMLENENYAPGVDRKSRYCPLHSTSMLKEIGGEHYRKIIDKMLEHQIIEIRLNENGGEAFLSKKLTKLYRIHPKLRVKGSNGKRYRHQHITHPDVIRAVKRLYDKRFDRQLETVEKKGKLYADIIRYGESFVLDITRLEHDMQNGQLDEKLLERAYRLNEKLSRWCCVDEYGGRLHSHLSNLPKELRKYLVLRDKPDTPLVMLDLKSSQPYFLSLLFYKPELLNLVPEFLPIKHLLDKKCHESNLLTFYHDCCNGIFYKKCFVLLGDGKQEDEEFTEEEKKVLKEKLFAHVFYGSNGNYHKDEKKREERHHVETQFKMLYPVVYDNLVTLKRTRKEKLPFLHSYYRSRKRATKMYSTPNCLAQKIESKILLDIIAATLFNLNIPVFSIHDAFILESTHLNTLKEVFDQVFMERLHVNPPKTVEIPLSTMQQ